MAKQKQIEIPKVEVKQVLSITNPTKDQFERICAGIMNGTGQEKKNAN